VGVGTTAYRDGADQTRAQMLEQIGRSKFGGEEHEPVVRRVRTGAGDVRQDPPPHLADVGGALAQRLVG
jgi:hypothetical protein